MGFQVSAPIGIAILCYEGFNDLVRCLRSVVFHTGVPTQVYVFDNSEKCTTIKEYVGKAHPSVHYLSVGKNVGCTVSRNRILEAFLQHFPKAEFLAILDEDIEVKQGWLQAMLDTARKYPRCGIAAWKEGVKGHRKITPQDHLVTEVASMCNLHRIKPLLEVKAKWGNKKELPWCEKMFFHKFDTLMCQRLNLLGWRTHVVRGKQLIKHHHPHKGVRRNPKWKQIFAESKRVLRQIQQDEKWDQLKGWIRAGKEKWVEWLAVDES